MTIFELGTALHREMPAVMRWGGAIARQLRQHNVALANKESGYSNTDALTLADLSVQELLVAALRDADPIFRRCAIKAEEKTGDLLAFASDAEFTICLDPIDGTKQYRDHTGEGWSLMLHVQTEDDVLYSLVFLPNGGTVTEGVPTGLWVEAFDGEVRCGEDDRSRPAGEVVTGLPKMAGPSDPPPKKIYMIGFQQHDAEKAEAVTAAGLDGVPADQTEGSVYDLLASGKFIGSLIHSPNIYDFPVSLQIARLFGGDAVWVHNGKPVHFRETWMDERADMLRLPGIVACSPDRSVLKTLCEVAKNWNPRRYED